MEPKRILQVVTIMNRGGLETMLMNYYRKLDKTKYQFDFLVHREEKGVYDDEIKALGGRIYKAPRIFPTNYGKYKSFLKNFLKEHNEFIAIHSHLQENSGFVLYYAKQICPKVVRISHSHTAKNCYDIKYPFKVYSNLYLKKAEQVRLSCGVDAGYILYKEKGFTVLKNAIDTEQFRFNMADRQAVRREWGVSDDEILVGNVARFSPMKNHNFIIDLCKNTDKKYKFMAVGTGELKERTEHKVKQKELKDRFIFTGLRADVERYLSAMDILIMPSLYEGIPVSGIEAQANGLTCLFSDRVDRRTDITGNCSFIPLQINAWKKAIECADTIHKDVTKAVVNSGYDVTANMEYLLKVYEGKSDITGKLID